MVIKQYWQSLLVYRLSFVLWRLREFLSSLTALTVWSVIYTNQSNAFNYSQHEMIAYVFLAAIMGNIVSTTSLNGLTDEIYSGRLITKLIRPMNIVLTWGFQDIADKLINFGFVIVEIAILFFIFQPQLNFNLSPIIIFVLIGWIVIATMISFVIQLLFGLIGFWSPDSWGPKFLYYMVLEFTAGRLYPLDILPAILQKILYLTPFPYLSYIQTQLFLGRVDSSQITNITLLMIGWLLVLSIFYKFIWKKGIKDYTAMGQ